MTTEEQQKTDEQWMGKALVEAHAALEAGEVPIGPSSYAKGASSRAPTT